MQMSMVDARTASVATIDGPMLHYGYRVLANVVQFVENSVSEGFKFRKQLLGHVRKAGEVVFGDDQRVTKDKVAQGRLRVEIFGFFDDFVLRIRRVGYLL